MTMIDPQSRWWNNDSVRWALGLTLIFLSFVCTFFGMCQVLSEGALALPTWFMILAIVSLPVLLAGTFTIAFGTADSEKKDEKLWPGPLAYYFIFLGSGALVGGYFSPHGLQLMHIQFALFIVGGVATNLIASLWRRRSREAQQIQTRLEREGVTATGTITRCRSYSVNYSTMTKVTVKFTDSEGNNRWVSESIYGDAKVGQRMKVRYLQSELGRKGSVEITRPNGR